MIIAKVAVYEFKIIFKIDSSKSVVCYVDVSFVGDWNQGWSEEKNCHSQEQDSLLWTMSHNLALSIIVRNILEYN